MQSNLSWYYIRHGDNSGRKWMNFKIITDSPYFSLTGELWGVHFEDFGENELRYNVTALYIHIFFKSSGGYTQQKIAF